MNDFESFVLLPESMPKQALATDMQEVADDTAISLSIHLRRKSPLDARQIEAGRKFLSHAEVEHEHGANFDDVILLFEYAHYFSLGIAHVHIASRTVMIVGTAANISRAFRVRLIQCPDGRHAPDGPIYVPCHLAEVITSVVGMDNRPKAMAHFRVHDGSQDGSKPGFTGDQVAKIYNFPESAGLGETIGIIELGGGYLDSDTAKYFSDLNLPVPAVKSVSVSGAKNNPGQSDADVEVALDIQVAGAVSPGANIVCYFAPNTEQGFLQAILACVHDTENKCSAISISWGASESAWSNNSILLEMDRAFQTAAALGISVFAASGDNGAHDNTFFHHAAVDFPAASPNVTACGGTTLVIANGERQETVWNDGNGGASGGGISDVFPRPAYQADVQMPQNLNSSLQGRGVPDLAAVAAPSTGYIVYVNGRYMMVGGTSGVSPLLAGYMARVNALSGRSFGLINPVLYGPGGANALNDIVGGDNSADGVQGYTATPGWDPVTGFGSPKGIILQGLLSAPPAQA